MRLRVHLETAGGDLRDVEHLVHEMAQVRRRGSDAIDRRNLPRREVAIEAVAQQLDEADDGVERRPQLVRDVGEELALRLVGALHVAVQALELHERPATCSARCCSRNNPIASRSTPSPPNVHNPQRSAAWRRQRVGRDDAPRSAIGKAHDRRPLAGVHASLVPVAPSCASVSRPESTSSDRRVAGCTRRSSARSESASTTMPRDADGSAGRRVELTAERIRAPPSLAATHDHARRAGGTATARAIAGLAGGPVLFRRARPDAEPDEPRAVGEPRRTGGGRGRDQRVDRGHERSRGRLEVPVRRSWRYDPAVPPALT